MKIFLEDGRFNPRAEQWIGIFGVIVCVLSAVFDFLESPRPPLYAWITDIVLPVACSIWLIHHGRSRMRVGMVEPVARLSKRRYLLLTAASNVGIAVGLISCGAFAEVATKGPMVAAGVIYAMLVNAFLLWLGRRWQVEPRFAVISCLIFAVAAVGATLIGVHRRPAQDDFLKLAFSSTPLNDIYPEEKRLLAEWVRRRVRNSEEYDRLAASLKPMVPALYSVDSFASADAIRATCGYVQQAAEADFSYAAQQENVARDIHERMRRINPESESLKWLRTRSGTEAAFTALEHEWLSSVMTLYSFADGRSKEMHVDQGKLVFSSESVHSEFSRLFDASQALHRSFQERLQASMNDRRQALSELSKLLGGSR